MIDEAFYQLPSIETISQNPMMPFEEDEEQFREPVFGGHNENLAEILTESALNKISGDLIDDIESDFRSRKEWEESLVKGLKQLGLKSDSRNFPFEHSAGVYSPIMIRTLVETFSNLVPELLPEDGPVKQKIVGEVTKELEDQAQRVETWVNLYLTQEAPEYYADFKKMLMWLPWVGSCFKKTYFDGMLGRPTSPFIKPQDFVVKYGTTSLATCWRMTEKVYMNEMVIGEKQRSGEYRNIEISADDVGENETSPLQRQEDISEGLTQPEYSTETDFTLYECHTYLDLSEIEEQEIDEKAVEDEIKPRKNFKPYIVTIHKKTQKILSIYRGWKEGDKDCMRNEMYTHFYYMEGLGFYGLGAAHMIGGLAEASTCLLRQTIDGQTLANFPGGVRVKGMRNEDNNIKVGPTEFPEIDTNGLPIQQAIMALPYNQPSPMINELKKELEGAGAAIMGAANMQIADFNPNVPVGTTYALLGLLYKVQSTVVRGIRDSQTQEYKKLYKLFGEHLPDTPYNYDHMGGNSYISRFDFVDQIHMVPSSDPHITSDIQRMMRSEAIYETAMQNPQMHNMYEVVRNRYKSMKMPEFQIDEIMVKPDEIMPLDPISENMNLMQGKAARASLEQDHQSHMIVHEMILNDPTANPQIIAETLAHIAAHKSMIYMLEMQTKTGMQLPEDPSQLPMEAQNQIAMAAAQAMMQDKQQQEQNMPPPPLDPAVVMLEDVKVKEANAELKAQTDSFKAQLDYEVKMDEHEIQREKLEIEKYKLGVADLTE